MRPIKKRRLPRKLKKRIIKCFGIGTYNGIIKGYLNIERYQNNKGCIIVRTKKEFIDNDIYLPGAYNPYLTFPKIK